MHAQHMFRHNDTITLRPRRMLKLKLKPRLWRRFLLHTCKAFTLYTTITTSSHIIYLASHLLRTSLLPAAWRLALTVLVPAPDQELKQEEQKEEESAILPM